MSVRTASVLLVILAIVTARGAASETICDLVKPVYGFADIRGELIVEMFERNGERYIRLGETAKYNCSD